MRNFTDYLKRKRAKYGDKFDPSDLAPEFIPFYENGARIEVENIHYNHTRRGTVGITTGWKPCFLLMARTNCRSSSDTLSRSDRVRKAVKR